MIFVPTTNETMIRACIVAGFDRPQMMRDGADPMTVKIPPSAKWILARRNNGKGLGVFCVEEWPNQVVGVHCCLLPVARGRTAIEACRGFLTYLGRIGYRYAIAQIPAYNRPMRIVAALAGMKRTGINRKSVSRGGVMWDQFVFERRLA